MRRKSKIIIVIGTRPEAIKMCPVVYELQRRRSEFEAVVLVTGQHKEMLAQVLEVFQVTPTHDLELMEPNQTLSRLTSKSITAIERVIIEEQPDFVLVQGDTTTSFVAGLAAFYQRVPVGHVEAGLRTYKKYSPFPEEMNRCLISVLADIHFAPTQTAADALLREGVDPSLIHITGNTVIDALLHTLRYAESVSRPRAAAEDRRSILLTAHRRENQGEPLVRICRAVRILIERYEDIEVTFPVHKNPNVRKPVFEHLSHVERIHLIEPADYVEFVQLMNRSHLILTDSGGVQEEAPSLGKPVLVLRDDTERPEAVDAGTVKIVGTDVDQIVTEASALLDDPEVYRTMSTAVNPYGDGHASPRIVDILAELQSSRVAASR